MSKIDTIINFPANDKDQSDYLIVKSHIGNSPHTYDLDCVVDIPKLDLFLSEKGYDATKDEKSVKVSSVFKTGNKLYFRSEELIEVADGVWMSYIKDVKQKVCYNIMLYVSPLLKSDEVIGNYIEPLMSVRKRQNQSDKVFYTVVYSQYEGYTLRPNPIKKVIVDKSTNYNDTFGSVSEIIEKSISERKTGIILLYGEPGTGKTHYLRYIISKFNKKRNFIYIPPALFDHLSNPEFVSFLSSNTGSVLIIEDAKELIRKDVHGIRAQGVNNLLNMSDGLLNDYLDIQIIITSNMGTDEVEPALLREGRLICEYEFTKLDKEKANQLAKNINRDVVFDEDVALSKVYNIDPKRIKKEVGGKIGFGR